MDTVRPGARDGTKLVLSYVALLLALLSMVLDGLVLTMGTELRWYEFAVLSGSAITATLLATSLLRCGLKHVHRGGEEKRERD